ncbi:hypothetical protein Ciccas_011205 [Cichlidogyrus casuarinus]|uniref:Mitochondrial DNA polymerase catalytic subunit n=1 Tax=Cichlidogyrus casuarinus TaxID=1844966 RepID=A0ABD2PRY4_9PLAT
MALEGDKAQGTDIHTKVAKLIGISRDQAKVLNYARMYGSGQEFTSVLLSKYCANLTPEDAKKKAELILQQTKGNRVASKGKHKYLSSEWKNGSESEVFNKLESIAKSPNPQTPVLGASLTLALNPKLVKDDFLPSRINWVVQSSAVDYLHCLLVCMRWLLNKHSIEARLCISIHDEVRYICREEDSARVAFALQISNLITRALFAYKLGMHDLPQSVAFFSTVEIDQCLRKNPADDCKTPSNPEGLETEYKIPIGKSFTIQDIIQMTNGTLDP